MTTGQARAHLEGILAALNEAERRAETAQKDAADANHGATQAVAEQRRLQDRLRNVEHDLGNAEQARILLQDQAVTAQRLVNELRQALRTVHTELHTGASGE